MTAPADREPGRAEAVIRAREGAIPTLDGDIGACLRRVAERAPDRAALLWPDGDRVARMSYAALLGEAERAAGWIAARASPGDRVAIWSRNAIEWILLEYGCALAGTVVAGWNPAWTDTECAHAAALAPPRLLVAGRDVRGVDLAGRAQAWAAPGREVHAIDGLRDRFRAQAQYTGPAVDPRDPFLLQFTSGTTGRPKGAVLSHAAALNGAWLRARLYDGGADDVWLNPVPLHHVGGAIAMVLGAMATGGAYVVTDRFTASGFCALMHATGATRVGGVPTMLIAALDRPDWVSSPLVRSIGLGGAQVTPALVARVRAAFGAPVVVAYGQSECPLVATTLPGDDPAWASGTVGAPAPRVEVRIRAPGTGGIARLDETGEIEIRAATAMDGYLGMPAETAAALGPDGFLRTGDLGSIDAEGRLRIRGRSRDVIIRGGENIYPAEVEAALERHPAVAAACVVGVPDPHYGQRVAAAIVPADGAFADAGALEAFAALSLSHFKVPRQWRFETALPTTASGKVRKVEVEAMFAAEAAPDATA